MRRIGTPPSIAPRRLDGEGEGGSDGPSSASSFPSTSPVRRRFVMRTGVAGPARPCPGPAAPRRGELPEATGEPCSARGRAGDPDPDATGGAAEPDATRADEARFREGNVGTACVGGALMMRNLLLGDPSPGGSWKRVRAGERGGTGSGWCTCGCTRRGDAESASAKERFAGERRLPVREGARTARGAPRTGRMRSDECRVLGAPSIARQEGEGPAENDLLRTGMRLGGRDFVARAGCARGGASALENGSVKVVRTGAEYDLGRPGRTSSAGAGASFSLLSRDA